MTTTHNPLKIQDDKAIVRDTGNVQVGDGVGIGHIITEIVRYSHQQGMDLVSVRIETPRPSDEDIARINAENNDCWEEHLRRADRRQTTGRGW